MSPFDWNAPFQISTHPQQIFACCYSQTSSSPASDIRTAKHPQEYLPENLSPLTGTSEMSFNEDFQLQTSISEGFYQQIQNTDFTMSHQTSCGIYAEDQVLPDPLWSWSMQASQQAPPALRIPFKPLSPEPTSLAPQYTSSCSSLKADNPREKEKPSTETCRIESTKRSRTFPCPDCEKQFSRRAELNRHRNSVHTERLEDQPILYPCKYLGCSRSGANGFKRKDNYIQHLRGPHNETIRKRRRGGRNTVNIQDLHRLYVVGANAREFELFNQSL